MISLVFEVSISVSVFCHFFQDVSVIIDSKPILTILLNCGIFLSGYVTMAWALSNLGNLYCKGRKKVDDFTLDSR